MTTQVQQNGFSLEGLSAHAGSADALLRIATGLFLVPHGAQKLFGWFGGYGLEATGQFFSTALSYGEMGFYAALGAGLVEFFGGLFLAAGLLTRLAALGVTVLLAVASMVHLGAGFFWTDGGWEYPILWGVLSLTFTVKGGGAYSLDKAFGLKL